MKHRASPKALAEAEFAATAGSLFRAVLIFCALAIAFIVGFWWLT